MSGAANRAKWVGMLLLHIPLYLVTSYVMRQLVGSFYGVTVKAGANLPPNFLLQHFLLTGFIDGFLAGLVGVFVLRATLLLPSRVRAADGPAWKHPQAWTWIIATVWFLFGILKWIAANSNRSVLAPSSGPRLLDVISVFFGRGCDLSAAKLDRSVFDACLLQLSCTHPWLGTIGYSAAAFIPVEWINRLKRSGQSAEELEISTQEQSRDVLN